MMISVPCFYLKFLVGPAASDAGTSNRRHCPRQPPAASSWKENVTPRKMLPGFREHLLGLVRGDLDEGWELQLGLGDFRRPDGDLRAILPLQHRAGDQAFAVPDRVG